MGFWEFGVLICVGIGLVLWFAAEFTHQIMRHLSLRAGFVFAMVLTGLTLIAAYGSSISTWGFGAEASLIWLRLLYAGLHQRWQIASKTFVRAVLLVAWLAAGFVLRDALLKSPLAVPIVAPICLLLPLAFLAVGKRDAFAAQFK